MIRKNLKIVIKKKEKASETHEEIQSRFDVSGRESSVYSVKRSGLFFSQEKPCNCVFCWLHIHSVCTEHCTHVTLG